jgi:hypothetical protein
MLIDIRHVDSTAFERDFQSPFYQIMMLENSSRFSIDFTDYSCSEHSMVFLSPYQHFQWQSDELRSIIKLEFHGDFYCIEYHKKEVACNGLLFNNIYLTPFVTVSPILFREIKTIFNKIEIEEAEGNPFSESVLKS